MKTRGTGQRLGSPATFNARAHATSKEVARLERLVNLTFRQAKATLQSGNAEAFRPPVDRRRA